MVGLLNFGKKVGLGAMRRAENFVTSPVFSKAANAGERFMSNKPLMIAGGLGVFGAGMLSEAGPAAMDATMATAFGDEQADRAFVGQDLSMRYFMGAAAGGVMGGIAQASAPGDFLSMHPPLPQTGGGGAAMIGASIGVGAAGGAVLGGLKRGPIGVVAGGALGAMAGTMAMGATAIDYATDNRRFYSESPFRTSSAMANSLNASGDIVLGMHNSRRGY